MLHPGIEFFLTSWARGFKVSRDELLEGICFDFLARLAAWQLALPSGPRPPIPAFTRHKGGKLLRGKALFAYLEGYYLHQFSQAALDAAPDLAWGVVITGEAQAQAKRAKPRARTRKAASEKRNAR